MRLTSQTMPKATLKRTLVEQTFAIGDTVQVMPHWRMKKSHKENSIGQKGFIAHRENKSAVGFEYLMIDAVTKNDIFFENFYGDELAVCRLVLTEVI